MPNSSNKPVLITGCSSGIGYTCAHGLKQRGYRVFATARKMEDVRRLRDEGLESYQLDLDDSISIQNAVKAMLNETDGEIYALFNNAAFGQPGAVEDLSRDVLRANFETNVFGTHELTTHIIPVMRKQNYGRIVQNSSVLGLVSLPLRGSYNASKFALEGLSDTLRLELNSTNIHVSLIEPGPITSKFRANAFAKYLENIDKDKSAFREIYDGMETRLQKAGPAAPFTLPPEAVLKKLVHALESPHPRRRYYVTVPTYLFAYTKRLLSDSILDKILLRVSKGENK